MKFLKELSWVEIITSILVILLAVPTMSLPEIIIVIVLFVIAHVCYDREHNR